VLVKEDRIVLIPRPEDFDARTFGLHKEIWAGVESDRYLDEERESWSR
jgi:hypothetical protein